MNYKVYAFLKIFILMGMIYGVFIGIAFGHTGGLVAGLRAGVYSGVLSGAFFAVILSVINALATYGIKEDTGPQQTRYIQVNMAYDEAFDLCKRSLQTLNHHRLDKADLDNGYIEAWYGFTFSTYGEIITFQLERNQDTKTVILLKSRPDFLIIAVDFGRSYRNIRDIINYMITQAEVHVVSSK